ncbi:ATP-binding cassette domain-containing protein [Anaerolentibacter hominis]|uniref:ATP-binding cassette domain-containing protein n=1 Tax=Anaerolentibacter hominis TaxID=3079009 RepID=UPI0031B894F9
MKIAVENLNMTYPNGKQALQQISFQIESPDMIGLVGPNGAGKSTLMQLLVAGLIPTGGTISVNGESLRKKENELKKELGYLPQSFGLYGELTVWQFLDYMAAVKGLRDSKPMIEQAIRMANLTEQKKTKIRTLSGGQRQRVGIAQAMLGDPELIIMDEPTVGLDPEERIHFRNLFSQRGDKKIVILSTHIIEDIQSICNRLIVINQGRILFDGPPEKLILQARGHVGTFIEQKMKQDEAAYMITSRVNTADGIACRIVTESLPQFAEAVEPTLEDAYMYLIQKDSAAHNHKMRERKDRT